MGLLSSDVTIDISKAIYMPILVSFPKVLGRVIRGMHGPVDEKVLIGFAMHKKSGRQYVICMHNLMDRYNGRRTFLTRALEFADALKIRAQQLRFCAIKVVSFRLPKHDYNRAHIEKYMQVRMNDIEQLHEITRLVKRVRSAGHTCGIRSIPIGALYERSKSLETREYLKGTITQRYKNYVSQYWPKAIATVALGPEGNHSICGQWWAVGPVYDKLIQKDISDDERLTRWRTALEDHNVLITMKDKNKPKRKLWGAKDVSLTKVTIARTVAGTDPISEEEVPF